MASRPRTSNRLTWSAKPLALLGLSALAPFTFAAETVQSLRYGASLYHYFQQDYFGALTELTAAQQLDDLGPHTDGAELLRGGITLSYGMDRVAEAIFTQQLQQASDSVDADQAWFYLGKLAWQRGDASRTAATLDKMAADYSGQLQEQAVYLRASANLTLGDEATTVEQLQALPEASPWRNYLAYNLGAAQAARGDWRAATTYFSNITATEPDSAEAQALHNKSLTAAGYAHLANGDLDQSGIAFQQVQLDSAYASRALLGYGWSAAEQGDYLAALSPWQQLAGRSLLDESTRESLLAVPYAYVQLDRPGTALEHYQLANALYLEEIAGLQAATEAFANEPLGPLLGIAEESSADWLFGEGTLPEGEFARHLQHLVTRHSFQVSLRELRDLYSIAGHLQRARQRLQVLQEVDEHQQQVWFSVIEQDRRNQLVAQQAALYTQTQTLQQRLQQAIAQGDGRLLADSAQTARWSRLDQASSLSSAMAGADDYRQRLRLLRGLLIWDDNEHYPARAWQARKTINELQALAAQSTIALQRVDAAIANRQQSDFTPRIGSLAERVESQVQQVALTINLSETHLRQVAIAEFERQGEQLDHALGQSQLAIARMHDRALVEPTVEAMGDDQHE